MAKLKPLSNTQTRKHANTPFSTLVLASLWLTLAFTRATWYFRTRARRDLALPPGVAFSSKEQRRLKHYFYGTTYLSVLFGTLRGRFRRRAEKKRFTQLAALAYFFDDLAEAFRGQDTAGATDWQNNPETYGRSADERGIALHFLETLYRELPEKDLPEFKSYLHRVFNLEAAGRQQGGASLSIGELQALTAEKGGCSVLLFRRVLDPDLPMAEAGALYEFGYLIQLCDDVFDVWFDRQAGTATLATVLLEKNELGRLREFFENQVAATRQAFLNLPYPRLAVGTALGVMHVIVALTRVCLRHYAKLGENAAPLPLDDREAMVVDMERWGNRWQAARFLLNYSSCDLCEYQK